MADESSEGKAWLFFVTINVGFWTAAVVYHKIGFWGATLTFFVMGLGYSFLGALAVMVCKWLYSIAFPNGNEWDGNTAAFLGSLWPLSILFWLIITPFFALINRLFK